MTLPPDQAPDASPYFVPRTGLKRTLKYRTQFRIAYYFLCFSAGLVFLGGLYSLYSGWQEGSFDFLESLLLVAALPALGVVLARRQLGALAFVSVQVRPDGLTYEENGQSSDLFFADVASVRVWHIPYFGGRFQLNFNNGRRLVFTSALERSEYILESLVAARPELLSAEDAQSFRRTAVAADHSWARLDERTMRRPLPVLGLYLGLPLLVGVACLPFLPSQDATLASAWSWDKVTFLIAVVGLNLVLGLGTWTIGELYLLMRTTRRLQVNPNIVLRDMPLERRVFAMAAALQVTLLAISLVTILLGIVRG